MRKEQQYIESFGLIRHLFGGPADPMELDWQAKHPIFPVDSVANAGAWDFHSLFWHNERARVTSSLWRAGYHGDDLANEMGRESSRGRASPDRVAQPAVNVKVGITVSGDLKGLISAVVSSVTSDFTHGPSSFDSHANYASPDHAIGIGAN